MSPALEGMLLPYSSAILGDYFADQGMVPRAYPRASGRGPCSEIIVRPAQSEPRVCINNTGTVPIQEQNALRMILLPKERGRQLKIKDYWLLRHP